MTFTDRPPPVPYLERKGFDCRAIQPDREGFQPLTCFFHDDMTESGGVDTSTGVYWCRGKGCKARGDVWQLLEIFDGCKTMTDKRRWLAKHGLPDGGGTPQQRTDDTQETAAPPAGAADPWGNPIPDKSSGAPAEYVAWCKYHDWHVSQGEHGYNDRCGICAARMAERRRTAMI